MYYNNEDDEERPRITPYNAFDVIQEIISVSNKHDTDISLAWSNLADLNANRNKVEHDLTLLKHAYYQQKQTIDSLKNELIPLLASLQHQVSQILPQENKK
jgi:hypothetical protein